MLAIPNCRKKARLIIPDRCGNTRPAAADADKTILRETRQKRRVNADAAQYRLVKRALFCVKKAKACGIARVHNRRLPAAELHGDIISDRAQRDCVCRHETMCKIIGMGNETIACCSSETGLATQICGPRLHICAFFTWRIAARVLPRVQRTYCIPLAVEIEDAVHLSGYTDAFDVGIAFEKHIRRAKRSVKNELCVLYALSGQRRREKGVVFAGFARDKASVLKHGCADRRCSDIYSQTFHGVPSFRLGSFFFHYRRTKNENQASSSSRFR